MSSALEIGTKFMALVKDNKESEIVDKLYDENIVSIEGQGSETMPARMEGRDAIRAKHEWWSDNHEIHSSSAVGPFVGHRDDQFAVQSSMDVTPKGGERTQMTEVGLFTVKNGKVVQEEFLYLMG